MALTKDLAGYQHPYVTVDGVLFRSNGTCLEVKLIQPPKLEGQWSLPGGFVSIDKLAIDTLREKMAEKANISGFYAEQLQTYDAMTRDERGRVLTIAYLCLTNDFSDSNDWFAVVSNDELAQEDMVIKLDSLAFDHGQIIRDAKERLTNKLWYSDLARYLLPEEFKMSAAQRLFEMLEGSNYHNNFRRNMRDRVIEVGIETSGHHGGPKATLYRWATPNRKEK